MEVALPALWLVAVSAAFYLAAKLILTPAIIGILRRIPAIGRLLESAANGIVNGVEAAIAQWIRPHLATLLKWFTAATLATLSLPLALLYYGAKNEEALKHLVGTKILAMVHAVFDPINHRVTAAINAVGSLGTRITNLDKRLTHGIEQGLRDLSAELLAKFKLGIDTLRRDVYGNTVPALEAEIEKIARAGAADIARVGNDIAGTASRLADLAKRLDVPLSLLESLIASVGIVGALSALETIGKCEPKLRSLCQYDPRLWDDFLLGILAVLAFPGLREMTMLGATVLDDLSGALVELAES